MRAFGMQGLHVGKVSTWSLACFRTTIPKSRVKGAMLSRAKFSLLLGTLSISLGFCGKGLLLCGQAQIEATRAMKKIFIYLPGLVLSFSISLFCQTHPGAGGTRPGNTSNGTSIPSAIPDPHLDGPDAIPRFLRVSGRVVPDDGTPLLDRAAIQSNCNGTVKTETYTDSKGNFSFDFSDTRGQVMTSVPAAHDSSPVSMAPGDMRRNDPRDPRDCQLTAVLASFTSQTLDLRARNFTLGHLDVGHIVVHRIGTVSGATISAKPIPEAARKDYFKGLEEKSKGKIDAARQSFRKAIDEFPQYAAAWLELGRIQNAQNDVRSGRESFQHAISADPSLLSAYQELAQTEAQGKDWQALAVTTDQMLKLDAQNHPEFWFYNCVSKYHLGDIDSATRSGLEGVKVDSAHRVPKLEYVLGIIFLQKGDASAAAEHLHTYLRINPNGPDAADAQKKLDELGKK